jgi:arylsulfatase A-like enzyme
MMKKGGKFQPVLVGLMLGSLLLAGAALGAEADEKGQRPNVLFIAIDDLNDWIGCLGGHPDTKTPNIDKLAGRGVLFTNAFCSAPACNPSRVSLLTGIRPSTSGVYHNSQPWRPAMPDAVTLPAHFKNAGYHVAGRGKIYHGGFHKGDESAWSEYIEKGDDPAPDHHPLGIDHPSSEHFDWGPLKVPDEAMDDSKVVAWAEEFLNEDHDKPFFLACGLFRPHLPWYVPEKYFEPFPPDKVTLPTIDENDLDDVPEMGRQFARTATDHRLVMETGSWSKAVSSYLACIHFTDTNVGRLLEALEKSPYADNTLIVLWGDHGWHLGEKLHWRKFALWEEATHCPLLIAGPGIPTGKKCSRPVTLLDITPTLAELCGLETLPVWEGVSLTPLLENPDRVWDRPALTTHGRGHHSLRSERWRYIRYADGTEELYDHESDPLEWKNLAGDSQFASIKKDFAPWLPAVNAPEAEKWKPQDR